MVILPFAGYLFYSGLTLPPSEELLCFPLNFGTYGFIGIILLLLIALLLYDIKIIISTIQTLGWIIGFLWGAFKSILFSALVLGISTGIIEVIYSSVDWYSMISNWGMEEFFYRPIAGISKTLGSALITSLLYDIPLIILIFKAISYYKKTARLRIPAQEARETREQREKQASEERENQKRIKRKRKEQEEKERREYERYILAQARAAKADNSLGEYSFFEGCTSVDQIDHRLKTLLDIYDVADGSGDPALVKVIKKQHDTLRMLLVKNDG